MSKFRASFYLCRVNAVECWERHGTRTNDYQYVTWGSTISDGENSLNILSAVANVRAQVQAMQFKSKQ